MKRHKDDIVKIYENKFEWSDGTRIWFNKKDENHREDGPAIERPDGYKAWYQNGLRHREDGPAVERPDGYKAWYQNGELHREDGPAVEWPSGDKEWWLNGKQLTKKNFLKKTQSIEDMTVEEICKALGKTIRIVK